ncbi:MAG: hypothetical protein O9256_01585 [Rhizobiaceae bacterium]|nr:hypothetical protein [Rhizobiaceae bacterium]MCZ8351792.1 hypothetical protein [Rhizobium sp.]
MVVLLVIDPTSHEWRSRAKPGRFIALDNKSHHGYALNQTAAEAVEIGGIDQERIYVDKG